jgi:phytoene dehydrogenase-like protein
MLGLRIPEDLPLVRRDPHYFMPTTNGRYLLLGADSAANARQFTEFFTAADWRAQQALSAELSALASDLAPAWLQPPAPLAETAERHIRPSLRQKFLSLVRGSAIDYLTGFGFASELLVAMYAVTDGMPGLTGSPWAPGSGHNLLVHNMCRLPGADGTWMVVRGGMGTVTSSLAEVAAAAGARIRTGVTVSGIAVEGGAARGVVVDSPAARGGTVSGGAGDGELVPARVVLAATDPYRLVGMLGGACPPALRSLVDGFAEASRGQTLKVNLALSGLPRFVALPEPVGQHSTTVHLMPPPAADGSVLSAVRAAFEAASEGRSDPLPPIEWYLHSVLDPGLRDSSGRHSSAFFVQGVPHVPAGSSWDAEKNRYVDRLLDFAETYAPGLSSLVVDVDALAPPDIEARFGITGGNIFHVDNKISFTDRMPYRVGVDGVYAGAAGCFPAGSVIGCAGHNAAQAILADLDLPPASTP